MVTGNPAIAAVFRKFAIDFYCRGRSSLREACAAASADPETVLSEILAVPGNDGDPGHNFAGWPPDQLVDHIYSKHHKYVESKVPEITGLLNQVCQAHGEDHPELYAIRTLFTETGGALVVHMKKEEFMIFPKIKGMLKHAGSAAPARPIRTLIETMMQDHADEGERFREIARLSNHYAPPENAGPVYHLACRLLSEFEQDLHQHIHLENNILFPKAIALEETMAGR